MTLKEKLVNTFIWGFALWLIGYIAGFILFFIVPKAYIGWLLSPFATIFTIWVLMKKVKRPALTCYVGLGVVWTIIAVVLDYIFLVTLLKAGTQYYKLDVFLYYALTFALPLIVGYWKYCHIPKNSKLF